MKASSLRKRWDCGEGMLLANPALVSGSGSGGCDLPCLAEGEIGFATSGSTGEPKIVIHTRASLEASARMVVGHLGVTAGERWLRALPDFHVGGFGVELRAWILGGEAAVLEGKWDTRRFCRMVVEGGICWSSLVPAQVADLVAYGEPAPCGLRGIVVGGGKLPDELGKRARALGWPVVASYGMTEAGSQVATGLPDEPFEADLPCLDGWELRAASGSGVLELRSAALATGYFLRGTRPDLGADDWKRSPLPGSEGWYRSSDSVALEDGAKRLRWLGREDSMVKILGELVSLDALQAELETWLAGEGFANEVAVVDLAEGRDRKLVLVVAGKIEDCEQLGRLVDRWNAERPGFKQLARVSSVEQLPRSSLGKLLLSGLRKALL